MSNPNIENTFEAVEWLTNSSVDIISQHWTESKVIKLWQAINGQYFDLPFDLTQVNNTVVANSLNDLAEDRLI